MLLRYWHTKKRILVNGREYLADCTVRNELNGYRAVNEVVKTMPLSGQPEPYYPRQFPTGVWPVFQPEYTDDPEFAPVKIPTGAKQRVFTWKTGKDGKYSTPTGEAQEDYFYHIHYSQYKTTLGCIRLNSGTDAVNIAMVITEAFSRGEKVWLEVLV
jgi:hypothetical protein